MINLIDIYVLSFFREKYIKESAQLLIRRKQLINELTSCIYPITEVKLYFSLGQDALGIFKFIEHLVLYC